MGYSGWLSRYLADPAAVCHTEGGHLAPSKSPDCTAVRLEFRIHAASPEDATKALERLAPPGQLAFGPVMIDDNTAAIAYRIDWEWAES